jgi:hypothetical protein
MASWTSEPGRHSVFEVVRIRVACGRVWTLAAATVIACCAQPPRSVETSIRPADCTAPAEEIAKRYEQRDLGVQECPAPDGWRLLLVSSNENTWVDLTGPGVTWSAERPVVYESPIGNFPTVGVPPTVEWRHDSSGRIAAIILGVTAQNRETFETDRSAFYVVRLQPTAACVIGRPATAEEARTLADSPKGC